MIGIADALYIIKPEKMSKLLNSMLQALIADKTAINVLSGSIPDMRNKKIVVAVELNKAGFCLPVSEIISEMYENGENSLYGSSAVVLIHSPNELNTKSTAADIVFQLNQLGCSFPGHPVIEATGSLSNFLTWQITMDMSLEDICIEMCKKLGQRFEAFRIPKTKKPYITALHSSYHETSNTLALWNMIRQHLADCKIDELHVENGTVLDCIGCSFKTCIHFSQQSSCFYGGIMVEEIFPAIEKSDAVIWLCPNYNDALSANLTAVVNRLTALYRKTSFQNKALAGVIVSGNSGSDSVAMQLIDALCINKGFYLPPYFSIMITANDPGAVMLVEDIHLKAKQFAENIIKSIRV